MLRLNSNVKMCDDLFLEKNSDYYMSVICHMCKSTCVKFFLKITCVINRVSVETKHKTFSQEIWDNFIKIFKKHILGK